MQQSGTSAYHPIGQVYTPKPRGTSADSRNGVNPETLPQSSTGQVAAAPEFDQYDSASLDRPETSLDGNSTQPTGGAQPGQPQAEAPKETPDPSRQRQFIKKALIGSAVIILVILLAILITSLLSRRGGQLQSPAESTPDQSVTLEDTQSPDKLPLLGIADNNSKLIVNGDIISQGSIYLASSNNYAQILSAALTGNHQYTLPNASGTFCLDSNNCGYLTEGSVVTTTLDGVGGAITLGNGLAINGTVLSSTNTGGTTTTINSVGGAITLQGTTNQINVSTAGQTLTLSTPQDIATSSTPNFASITLAGVGTQNGFAICDASDNCGFAPVGDAFVQNGNSFGAAAVLGTNDAYSLSFETSGATQASIAVGGAATFQNSTDSTSGFRVMDADGGNPVLNVDTTNERIGIGTATPATTLDVVGDAQISTKAQVGNGTGTISQCRGVLGLADCNAAFEVSRTGVDETANSTYGIYNYSGLAATADTAVSNYGAYNQLALLLGGVGADYTGNQYGSYNSVNVLNAVAVNTFGSYNIVTGNTGSITQAVGVAAEVQAGGGISTSIGVKVITASGPIDTNYGILVQDQTGSNTADYGIAIEGADTYALWLGSGADNTDAANGITFGLSGDTNLYRSAASVLRTDDVLSVGTLGTTDTAAYLCYNSSSQLAACSGTGPGAAFVQGGNSFGAAAVLGTNDTNTLSFETDGTTKLTIGTNGHIGLGSTVGVDSCALLSLGTCSVAFNNQNTITDFTSTNNVGINNNLLLNPGGAVGTTTTGALNIVETASANGQNFSAVRAARNTVTHRGTGSISVADGAYNDVTNSSSGTISNAAGLQSVVNNSSNGTITNATGVGINVLNTGSGTIGTVKGISITAGNAGTNTVTTNYGIDIAHGAGNTGAVTTNYGINIQAAYSVGAITTNYGINVAAQTAGTSDYGIAVGAADTQTLWLSSNADNTTAAAGIAFGLSRDTNLYRSAANRLATDDRLDILGAQLTLAGGTTVLRQTASNATTNDFITSNVSGDANYRFRIYTNGQLNWGDGTSVADTNLYRSAADTLKTDDKLSVGTLGTTDNAAYLCLNTSNILAACSGTAAGAAFIQGGNSFGAAATLGTNDSNSLSFETGGTTYWTISTAGVLTASNSATISVPGVGTNSERFGLGAAADGNNSLAVGNGASSAGIAGVAIGMSSSASGTSGTAVGQGAIAGSGSNTTAIGRLASATSNQATALGGSASATATDATAIGYGATAAYTDSIALGQGATTTGTNQLVIGSNGTSITNVYVGKGFTNASPANVAINATGGSGTDIAGAAITIAGGRGTGSAIGGAINFQTTAAGASGSTARALTTVLGLAGGTGYATFQGTADGADAFRVLNTAGTVETLTIDTTAGTDNVAQFNSSTGNQCTVVTGTGWSCTSDATLKTNVATIQGDAALDTLSRLRAVTYNWLADPNGTLQNGFIAQEVQAIMPELVTTDGNGHLSLAKDGFIPLLVSGVNAQQVRIADTNSRIDSLEQQVAALTGNAGQAQAQSFVNLNLAGTTTIETLQVTGSSSIAGNLNVAGSVSITGDLTIQGHVKGNADTRGEVIVPAGQLSADYTFDTPYTTKPFVVASPVDKPVSYGVVVTPTGFSVKLAAPDATDTAFNFLVQQ